MRKILVLIGVVVLVLGSGIGFSPVVLGYGNYPTIYESFTAGDDAVVEAYGNNWMAETFTTTSAHTITSIWLKGYRTGAPGIFTVSLREVDGDGHPVGFDIASGTYDADLLGDSTPGGWFEVEMSSETAFEYGEQYAIVFRAVAGDSTNKVHIRYDNANGYAGGVEEASTNGGATWGTTAANDFLFQVYGNEVIEMMTAVVFSGYLEPGDWIITCLYSNEYPPYYAVTTPQEYFSIQLLDGATVLAQVKMPAWGKKPGSIYLSEAAVAGLEWGSDYIVRLYGTTGENPYDDYTLVAGDWMGEDFTWFDGWILYTASSI